MRLGLFLKTKADETLPSSSAISTETVASGWALPAAVVNSTSLSVKGALGVELRFTNRARVYDIDSGAAINDKSPNALTFDGGEVDLSIETIGRERGCGMTQPKGRHLPHKPSQDFGAQFCGFSSWRRTLVPNYLYGLNDVKAEVALQDHQQRV